MVIRATASISDTDKLRLFVSVLPVNSSELSTHFRDLPLTKLTGPLDDRSAMVHAAIVEMWDSTIADEACNQAVSAVAAEFIRIGIPYTG